MTVPGKRGPGAAESVGVRTGSLSWSKRRSTRSTAQGLASTVDLHAIGRSEQLDADAMRRLAGSLLRYLDGAPDADDSGAGAGEGLRLLGSRPMGAASSCGPGWASTRRSRRRSRGGGWTQGWSGCCSRWSRTGRSPRGPSWRRWSWGLGVRSCPTVGPSGQARDQGPGRILFSVVDAYRQHVKADG